MKQPLITIHAKAIAASFQCQAHNDVRYYLQGIAIQPDGTGGANVIGTDGHKMLVVNDANGVCQSDIIINFPKTFITKCKQASAETVSIIKMDDDVYMARIESTGYFQMIDVIEGRYPDWKAVIPEKVSGKPGGNTAYDSKYVSILASVGKILDVYCGAMSIVNGDDSNKPVTVLYGAPAFDGLHVRGVLMPVVKTNLDWLPEYKPALKAA